MYWIAKIEGGPHRVNHASVAVGHLIYTFGGYSSQEDDLNCLNKSMDIHIFNTWTNQWFKHPFQTSIDEVVGVGVGVGEKLVPYKRYGHTAVEYNKKIYIFGGRSEEKNASSEVYCFDVNLKQWVECATYGDVPAGRDGHSACVVNNLMYIFGGYEDESEAFAKSTIYTLNLDTLKWTSHLNTTGTPPPVRDFHSCVCIKNKLYIFGGRGTSLLDGTYSPSTEVCHGDLWSFDLKNAEWKCEKIENSLARRSHSAFVYKDKMYIFGGYSNEYKNDVYEYNPDKNQWRFIKTQGSFPPTKRRKHSNVLIDNKLYLYGGASPSVKCDCDNDNEDDDNDGDNKNQSQIIEQNDLYILDFDITLKVLSLITVNQHINKLDLTNLPHNLRRDLECLRRRKHTLYS